MHTSFVSRSPVPVPKHQGIGMSPLMAHTHYHSISNENNLELECWSSNWIQDTPVKHRVLEPRAHMATPQSPLLIAVSDGHCSSPSLSPFENKLGGFPVRYITIGDFF